MSSPIILYAKRFRIGKESRILVGAWDGDGLWLWIKDYDVAVRECPTLHPVWTTRGVLIRPPAHCRQLSLPGLLGGEAGSLPARGAERAASGGAGAEPPRG